jgi:hypothetical protein
MLGRRTSANAPMQGGKHAHYLPVIRERRLTGLAFPLGGPVRHYLSWPGCAALRRSTHLVWGHVPS